MQHHTYSGSEGSAFLRELRGFLSFLASLWGTLTAVSLAFPLSNVFVRVIPLEGDESFNPLALMPSAPIAATATLVTLFLVLATFGARHEFAVPTRRRRLRRRRGDRARPGACRPRARTSQAFRLCNMSSLRAIPAAFR